MYKAKASTGQFDTHRGKYTEEQLKVVQESFGEWLYYYGYADVDENPTGFFYKGAEHTAENRAKHNQFRRDNAETIKHVSSEAYIPSTYVHNHGDERITLLDDEDTGGKVIEPAMDHAAK